MIKKLTAVLLCVTTLIALCSIPTSAGVWHDEGLDMLRSQWQEGEGPSVLGFNIDYSYYVPETDNPCPLMIFMGGAGNGTYEGKELEATSFPYWSSVEYQAMAENADGMYLMILRSPLPFYFDTCPLVPMYEAIRDFVDTHNVDKKRICLFGRCLGASGVNRLANAYPDYFSGACYMCPRTVISASDARAMKNMKVWILCSMLDSYSIFPFYTLPSWFNEILFTKDRTNIRLTNCLTAPRGGGFLNHEVYWLMDENFSGSILNSYTGLFTIDGNGKNIPITEINAIKFFTSGDYTPAPEPTEPDNPDNPDNPDVPDNPDNPDKPDNPDNPDNPDTPVTPDVPATPVEPENPGETQVSVNQD